MSRRTATPVNQVRLSNVAVVRLAKKGTRFEVACYPNKVVDYRKGVETDLDEVVQVVQVFKNASKGEVASKKEVAKAFGGASIQEACVQILTEGELQVSEKERAAKLEGLFRDVAVIVAEKTMDAQTARPVPAADIEVAMRDRLGFAANAARSAKQQALEVIRKLEAHPELGIVRAKMRLKIVGPFSPAAQAALLAVDGVRRDTAVAGSFLAEPRAYRAAALAVETASDGAAALEVLDHAARVLDDDDAEKRRQTTRTESDHDSARSGTQSARLPDDGKALSTSNHVPVVPPEPPQGGAHASGYHPPARAADNDNDDDDAATVPPAPPRQANKKSKAAKRREKEDAAERAEAARREEDRRRKRAEERQQKKKQTDATATEVAADVAPAAPLRLTCNTCGGTFSDAALHREHFRSDLHRHNLKRKLEGLPPLSESDFNDLALLTS